MRALLDINVIIALLDPDHAFHERAHEWWTTAAAFGWASSPLTENGVIRIMSNPSYSSKIRFAPGDLINRLRTFVAETNHELWQDDVSLRDERLFAADRIHSSRQLTDIYLLALATKYGGQLATFDQNIALSTVRAARPENLYVL